MPYISQDKRTKFQNFLENFRDLGILEAGELNYLFSSMLIIQTQKVSKISYDLLNSFLGVLEAVKIELYRRIISDYEDQKMEQNGDLF